MALPVNRFTLPLLITMRFIVVMTRLRGLERIVRLMFDPNNMPDFEFDVSLGQLFYRGATANFVDWNVLFYGAYEEDDLIMLESLARTSASCVFLDIGANVGQHALYLSAACERIIAFEPDTTLHAQFKHNIYVNSIQNIELHAVAIGDADAQAELFIGRDRGGNSLLAESNSDDVGPSVVVNVRHGDRFLNSLVKRDTVRLIKIDVEGYEASVLRGLDATLRSARPIVMLEVSEAASAEFGSVESFLGSFPSGYKFYSWTRACGIWRGRKLDELGSAAVLDEFRNVYAVPDEKVEMFIAVSSMRPRRIWHRSVKDVRAV